MLKTDIKRVGFIDEKYGSLLVRQSPCREGLKNKVKYSGEWKKICVTIILASTKSIDNIITCRFNVTNRNTQMPFAT